jgi:hypothetical protein
LQRNKHNEQQPFNSEILRNLGNARENPNVGKPKRERDFISFRKDISAATIQFPAKRNSLTAHKTAPTIFCLGKRAKSVLLYGLPRNQHLDKCALNLLYGLLCTALLQQEKPSKTASKIVPNSASISVPSFPCCTDCTDPYSMASNSSNNNQRSHRNIPLGFVPNLSWKCTLLAALFPLSSSLGKSLSNSFSMCLAHYPMHSLII